MLLCAMAVAADDRHDVRLGHRVEAFRVHGYLADIESEYEGMVVDDWVWCFIDYPLWATDLAMKRFLACDRGRPTPAAVREHLPVYWLEGAKKFMTAMMLKDWYWAGVRPARTAQ